MKIIIRQYGGIVFSVIIGLVLIGFFAGNIPGWGNIYKIGENIICEQSSSVMNTGFDDSALEDCIEDKNVEIQRIYEGNLYCGQGILLSDYINIYVGGEAIFPSEKGLENNLVELMQIRDKNGELYKTPFYGEQYYLYFEEEGYYELFLKVKISSKKISYARLKVLVNREKVGP